MIPTIKYNIEIQNARKEISDVFGFNIENIEFIIAENRNEYEKILGRKTAEWEVGNSNSNKKSILLLDPEQWTKEAQTHKPEELPFIIKHELTHIYTDALSNSKVLPIWLIEGLAGTLSGQYKTAKMKIKYFEDNFCSKLDTPYNWNQRSNSGAYSIAYLFTHYLFDKYGFEKIKLLIRSSLPYYYYNHFNETILDVFGKNLIELEQDFLNNFKQSFE
ncbi:MAG: hypothetical protein AB1465_05955 [Patescibacteria group bacterium]